MRQSKILGLAVTAALALSAVAATVASATAMSTSGSGFERAAPFSLAALVLAAFIGMFLGSRPVRRLAFKVHSFQPLSESDDDPEQGTSLKNTHMKLHLA